MIATMSTVWDRTTEFLGDNLAVVLPIVLLAVFVPLTLLGSLMPVMGTVGAAGNLTLAIILLLLAFLTAWGGLAITALAFAPAAGRGEAVRVANQRFLPLLGVSLAMLLIVVALIAPVGIALGLSGVDMMPLATGSTAAAAGPVGGGSVDGGSVNGASVNGGAVAFAVLYGTILTPLLLFVYARFFVLLVPIVVMERRGLGAFARSFVLTRTIAWKVIGMLLLYLILSTVAGLAAKTVFGTILRLLLGDEGPLSLANVLTHVATSAISTLFSVLAVAFIAKLYLAARDAREAIVEGA